LPVPERVGPGRSRLVPDLGNATRGAIGNSPANAMKFHYNRPGERSASNSRRSLAIRLSHSGGAKRATQPSRLAPDCDTMGGLAFPKFSSCPKSPETFPPIADPLNLDKCSLIGHKDRAGVARIIQSIGSLSHGRAAEPLRKTGREKA